MKRFSLPLLCALIVGFTTALVFLLLSHREKDRLHNEIVNISETLDSAKHLLDSRDKQLEDGRLGTSLLYRMALSGNHDDLFAFLDTVPDGSLSCKIIDLPESPSIRLFWYTTYPKADDGTWLSTDKSKRVYIIVRSDSLEAVDCVMHTGYSGPSKSPNEPYRVSWSLSDGSRVNYKVLPSGFEQYW